MASFFSIRPASTGERETLEALQWRASLNNSGDREALLAHPDAIVLPDAQIEAGGVFVAERDNVIIGFAAVQPRADGTAELDGLFVEPALWKHGIGRSLVNHCAAFASAGGASALHVTGNPHSLGFYNACGFEQIGVEKTRFGAGLVMRKQL